MSDDHQDDPPIAPLHIADIDEAKLRQLFFDVESLGEGLEIILKRAVDVNVDPRRASLADAMNHLLRGTALGVQLRYRFQGAEWWDTVMRTPAGLRLVRIQHAGDAGASRA